MQNKINENEKNIDLNKFKIYIYKLKLNFILCDGNFFCNMNFNFKSEFLQINKL